MFWPLRYTVVSRNTPSNSSQIEEPAQSDGIVNSLRSVHSFL